MVVAMLVVIDNGSKHIRKLLDYLEIKKIDFELLPFCSKVLKHAKGAHAFILSGSSHSPFGKYSRYFAFEEKFVKESNLPILGICFGLEIIVLSFGGKLEKLEKKIKGKRKIKIVKKDRIFKGLGEEFTAYEGHKLRIKEMPRNFEILARSRDCIEVIKHREREIYGLQFHPEVGFDGQKCLENFLKIYKNPTNLGLHKPL
jgi:GMP synthase (glutamine-hydrolysing)